MNDIDELMSRDPLKLSKQDIDAIIAYHRNQRTRKAAGEKVTKPTVNIDFVLNKLQAKLPDTAQIKRRI